MNRGRHSRWSVLADAAIESHGARVSRERQPEPRIIPRDFRSVYSLADHFFLPVTFAAARRGAESADVFLTIAARGATIIRCQRSRTLVQPDVGRFPGYARAYPKGSLVLFYNCRLMPRRMRTQSERIINELARIESHHYWTKIISYTVKTKNISITKCFPPINGFVSLLWKSIPSCRLRSTCKFVRYNKTCWSFRNEYESSVVSSK